MERDPSRALRTTALVTLSAALVAALLSASAAWLPPDPAGTPALPAGAAALAGLAFLGALRIFVLARAMSRGASGAMPASSASAASAARASSSPSVRDSGQSPSRASLEDADAVPPAGPRPAPPPQAPSAGAEPGSEALMLLSLLQEKGRLLDFLMEDIAAYGNEQVGAAARVVHQGCRAVVEEAFAPVPVAPMENARIVLEPGYDAGEFRLVGPAESRPPFTVKVTHKGWRARHVRLPRRIGGERIPDKPVIVPAEVAA